MTISAAVRQARAHPDVVDRLAGVRPGSRLDQLRRLRPAAREQTQRTHDLLFGPQAGGWVGRQDRLAIATYVAALHRADLVTDHYAQLLGSLEPHWVAPIRDEGTRDPVAGPGPVLSGGLRRLLGERTSAALTYAHLTVLRPDGARPDDLAALTAAGWNRQGIVTITQTIGFLSYQIRLVHGLHLLAEDGAA